MPDFSIADVFSAGGLAALAQVIAIDLMLAGDNVVVLGTLTARLDPKDRRRVLAIGVGISLTFLIAFAWFATQLLQIVGLLAAGGLLLLWVAWKLFREIRSGHVADAEGTPGLRARRGFWRAVGQVVLADLSMSLDNVLAVAGAAREHPTVLFFGLALSVTLMALAANLIARIIQRYRWIAYVGLAIILFIALRMIHDGLTDPAVGVLPWLRGTSRVAGG